MEPPNATSATEPAAIPAPSAIANSIRCHAFPPHASSRARRSSRGRSATRATVLTVSAYLALEQKPPPIPLPRQHPTDRVHQLVGVLVSTTGILQAMAHVVVHQPKRDLVEGGTHGVDLSHNVNAVALVLDHARDATHLALDAREPLEQVVL